MIEAQRAAGGISYTGGAAVEKASVCIGHSRQNIIPFPREINAISYTLLIAFERHRTRKSYCSLPSIQLFEWIKSFYVDPWPLNVVIHLAGSANPLQPQ